MCDKNTSVSEIVHMSAINGERIKDNKRLPSMRAFIDELASQTHNDDEIALLDEMKRAIETNTAEVTTEMSHIIKKSNYRINDIILTVIAQLNSKLKELIHEQTAKEMALIVQEITKNNKMIIRRATPNFNEPLKY